MRPTFGIDRRMEDQGHLPAPSHPPKPSANRLKLSATGRSTVPLEQLAHVAQQKLRQGGEILKCLQLMLRADCCTSFLLAISSTNMS
jgi:hypothetical protein